MISLLSRLSVSSLTREDRNSIIVLKNMILQTEQTETLILITSLPKHNNI